MEHPHGMTLERLREHLARADARTLVGDALETTRWRLEGSDRG